MATNTGISLPQVAKRSFLKRKREIFLKPEAANLTKVVASVDPSGVAIGAALTLQANVSGKKLRYARRATVSVTDASGGGGGLSCVVTVTGFRFGAPVSDTITATATSGSELTATGTQYFDQITGATLSNKVNAASGDALKVGQDGTSLGLEETIAAVTDVKSITKLAAGVEQAPIVPSNTTVDAVRSAIIGLTIAATDDYEVEYDRNGVDGIGPGGVEA